MIRFTLLQFRTQAIIAIGATAIVAVVLAVTGADLVHLYDANVANCKGTSDCSAAAAVFLNTYSQLQTALGYLVIAVPGLIGIFWGAPLIAREFEAGTHRLVWTQSQTRTRWLATKTGVGALASAALVGLLSLIVTWWFSPIDKLNMNRFQPPVFDERAIVPIGYAAFAFALGLTAGVLIRRTVPAMGATLIGFAAARVADFEWLRPHLLVPIHLTVPNTRIAMIVTGDPGSAIYPNLGAGDWIISDQTINAAGQTIGQGGLIGDQLSVGLGPNGLTIGGVGSCPNISLPPPTSQPRNAGPLIQQCVDQLHLRDALTFQPYSRYWTFQWIELALFVGFAVLLAGFCLWWARHRLS